MLTRTERGLKYVPIFLVALFIMLKRKNSSIHQGSTNRLMEKQNTVHVCNGDIIPAIKGRKFLYITTWINSESINDKPDIENPAYMEFL